MSWRVLFPTLAGLDALEVRPPDRFVLVVLADCASESGTAWPAAGTIAARTGYDPGQVRKSLTRLEAAGLLEIRRRPGRSPVCTIVHNPAPTARGEPLLDPAPTARTPAPTARTPAPTARRNQLEPVMNPPASRCPCGARWIAEDGTCPLCEEQMAL